MEASEFVIVTVDRVDNETVMTRTQSPARWLTSTVTLYSRRQPNNSSSSSSNGVTCAQEKADNEATDVLT